MDESTRQLLQAAAVLIAAADAVFAVPCVPSRRRPPDASIPDGVHPNCANNRVAGFKLLLFPVDTVLLVFVATDVGGATAPAALPPPPWDEDGGLSFPPSDLSQCPPRLRPRPPSPLGGHTLLPGHASLLALGIPA